MQSPHPEMCENTAHHNLFSLQKKKWGDNFSPMMTAQKTESLKGMGALAKFNVINCMFSIQSQF